MKNWKLAQCGRHNKDVRGPPLPPSDWRTCPTGGGHYACERGQGPGERPEAVRAGRPGRRPAGRSLTVWEQRRQTQEQVLVEKLQGGSVCYAARAFQTAKTNLLSVILVAGPQVKALSHLYCSATECITSILVWFFKVIYYDHFIFHPELGWKNLAKWIHLAICYRVCLSKKRKTAHLAPCLWKNNSLWLDSDILKEVKQCDKRSGGEH